MKEKSAKFNFDSQDPNNYWEQLERLEKLVRASELKAGIVFSFHTIIFGIFIERIVLFGKLFNESTIFIVFVFSWIFTVLLSIFYCFKSFIPRIETKFDKNVFFFRDAANSFGDVKQFSKNLMEVCGDNEKLFTQLSEQIHIESKIIDRKFISINKSIIFLIISVVLVIIIFLYSLIQS
jgi:hypothetical protein